MPTNSSPLFDLGRLQALLDDGVLLLTPNLRLARRIKAEWDRQQMGAGKQVWRPAAVKALEHWLEQCWQAAVNKGQVEAGRVLTGQQESELWRLVIEDDRAQHGEYSLLQSGSAADLARQARDNLLRAQLDMARPAVASEFRLDPDCSTFQRWLQAFEQRLAQLQALTTVDRLVALAGVAAGGELPRVALVDFDDVTPLHRACLKRLATEVVEVASAAGEAPLVARSYPDRQAELGAVARWAAEQYRQRPQARLGILLADMHADRAPLEYLLRREFDCLGENYTALPVNFSTGISLDRAPVVRDALRVLASCGSQLPMADILGLVRSRFVALPDRDDARCVKLLQQLFEDGAEQVDSGRLRYLARRVKVADEQGLSLGTVLSQCSEMRLQRLRQAPSAWVADLTRVLDAWGWPGSGPLDSLEYQQVESWYRVLETFASHDSLCGELDLGPAVALLQRCCQAQVSQPQTADSRIQVLGPLEAAGLQFDDIWFCGLQGSRWPAPARPNPFIPMVLQRRHEMPHSSSEREWQYAATLMRQYRAGCRHMTGSYARQLDGAPELPSPLLRGASLDAVDTAAGPPAQWLQLAGEAQLLYRRDHQAPPLTEAELAAVRGGSGIIQAQANCPFQAFAGKRLRLEPLADTRAGLSAADRGSILHDALYALWGSLENSDRLHAADEAAIAAAVGSAVDSALAAVPEGLRQLVGMHCLDLERERLRQLLQEWLQLERSRAPFTVIAREAPLSFRLGELELKLRVDRIDELGDGSRLLIDYKSGRNSLAHWLGERPSQPQLPLYGLASPVAALAFAEVRPRQSRFLGLGQVSGVSGVQDDIAKGVKRYSACEDWDSLLGEWQRNLSRLAEDFIAGEAAVDPLASACNFCGLDALCRVAVAGEDGA
ncbi:PD-(D/E)XK nuclease family protein [Seongchinamella sediminis]|uniref:PD-(D/E)XK nuclease family protein n=1 Tax=Seongchinamella sediminis TaxID=2283635 RepID=UPI0013C2FE1B|nr:PD-(D/E)XK nuclease family protein [Seongchinamella sediminis]